MAGILLGAHGRNARFRRRLKFTSSDRQILKLFHSHKLFLQDIRFWILLFFIVRLYGITLPPLEVAHNWRQATVTMVARNFAEVDANILYPRIDIAGEKTGITGMEFPFLNYLVYLVSGIFGYQHWYGRLLNLIVSTAGVFYFYKLIRKYFEEKMAFLSAIILITSLWFMYSRKIMPDTFAVSMVITGMYYGSEFLQQKRMLLSLMLFSLFLSLGLLSKLPAISLLFLLPVFLFQTGVPRRMKAIFVVASFLSLLLPFAWYFYWVPKLVQEYGFWHFFMGKSIGEGIHDILAELPLVFEQFYFNALKFIGFAMFVVGIVMAILKKQQLILAIFSLGFLGFLGIIFKSGSTFAHHSYYMVPFVPVMALVAANGLITLPGKRTAWIILLLIGLEGVANQAHDFRIRPESSALLSLENDLDKVSGRGDLIMINSGMVPTPMYFAHRKGWVDFNERIGDTAYIHQLQNLGLKNIVVLKKTFGTEINLPYTIVLNNENYCIYKVLH
jgi:4-amino-4-deoxy-L-arabinose transferase-like glycosyltransferase